MNTEHNSAILREIQALIEKIDLLAEGLDLFSILHTTKKLDDIADKAILSASGVEDLVLLIDNQKAQLQLMKLQPEFSPDDDTYKELHKALKSNIGLLSRWVLEHWNISFLDIVLYRLLTHKGFRAVWLFSHDEDLLLEKAKLARDMNEIKATRFVQARRAWLTDLASKQSSEKKDNL